MRIDDALSYLEFGDPRSSDFDIALNAVINALKAQEPRILTADEMKAWDKDVWVEYFGDGRIVVVDEHLAASMTEFAMSMKCDKVRFWTARPTMEQREAAPWK